MNNKKDRIEKALYDWLNLTEQFESKVCDLIDEKTYKRELIKSANEIKVKFRKLEDLIKVY